MRRTLLAAALLTIGLHAQPARALGLGPLSVQSAIGEPFRGEVRLLGSAGEPLPASTCFSLDQPVNAGADDLPWLSGARIRLLGRTAIITASFPVSEPILMVGLRVGCGHEVIREYTVLMQPRTEAPLSPAPAETSSRTDSDGDREKTTGDAPAAVVAGSPAEASTASSVAPARTVARKARRTAVEQGPRGDRLRVAPALDFGDGMKMSAGLAPRPPASEAQREALRTEQKLLAALDEQIATHLAIADKVKQLEARLAALQKQLERNGHVLDVAGAPATQMESQPRLDSPAGTPAPPVDGEPAGEHIETPLAEATEPAAGLASGTDRPAPPPGLTNEPVKVMTKLPPDTPPDEAAPAGGLDWVVAGLGALAAAAVLGGGWLWRRRATRLAEARARRQREMAERMAGEALPRRREQRSADADFARFGETSPNAGLSTQPAPSWQPVRAVARDTGSDPARNAEPDTEADAGFEGEVVPPMDHVPPAPGSMERSRDVAELSSIGYFPGEALADHMADVALSTGATATGEQGAEPAAGLEYTPQPGASVDFELGSTESQEVRPAAKLDLEFDTFVGSASSIGTADPAPAGPTGPRLVASNPAPLIDQGAPSANEEAPPSHEHVLELAEIMMSFGRAEGAAQTLSDFLRDYPKESLVPWLKLLDLYHKGGRRGEYDDLAPKLNRAFNVKVPEWENFTGPITSESVEQFAHIMARVNATWPQQDCLDYLTELLRDNRAGTRVGFPLGVIDDILLLRSMLEWLIANPPVTNTSASRLALL